jgi:hypothetical protein
VEEHKVVEKILRCVLPRLKQIVLAILMLLDVQSLTIANLAGRLKVVEEAIEEPLSSMQHEGKLYSRRKSGMRGKFSARWRIWVLAVLESPAEEVTVVEVVVITDAGSSDRGPQKNDECCRCGKLGHWARECRSKARKEQAHMVQDEEASFMVVRATIMLCSAGEALVVAEADGEVEIRVVIHEERVFRQLQKAEPGRDAKIWNTDFGATNHMTRSRMTFIELDTHVRGMVRFIDDSVVEIEGRF